MSIDVEFEPQAGLKMKFSATSQKDVVDKMSAYSEIFGISQCQACKSKYGIRWQTRNVTSTPAGKKKPETFTYRELVCKNSECRARLSFGSLQEDPESLFPKRKDPDGKYLPNGGWVVFQGKKQGGEEAPATNDAADASF